MKLYCYLARTLSIVIATASFVITLQGAGCVAAARSTPRVTIVSFGASLASKSIVAYSTRTLSQEIALRLRRTKGACTEPAPNTWDQVPGTWSAPVAMFSEGQGWAHASTSVRITDVTWSHTWIANCKYLKN